MRASARILVSSSILLLAIILGFSSPVQAGGVLRLAGTANFNTLDPAKAAMGEEYVYAFCVFNALTRLDRDMKVQPDLAERWESNDSLTIWTFYLRRGVKFHHGRELDAQDVAETIKRIMDKATGSRARILFNVVDKIEVIDTYTIRFNLNIPYSAFPEILAERQARIVPRDRIDTLATKPMGTGPFMFKIWKQFEQIELVKNPDYFEKGLPLADGVNIVFIPETLGRTTALETGTCDITYRLPFESIEPLKRNPNTVVEAVPSTSWDAIVMHNEKPPFNNVKVRKAIDLAINKERMVEICLFGYGSPANAPIAPNHPFFNKKVSLKTDLAQSKKLLAEAGFPNGFEVEMLAPEGRPQLIRLAVATTEALKEVGINVKVRRVMWDKFVSDVEGKELFYTDTFDARPSGDFSLYPWYHSTGSWNSVLWHYKNANVDRLLDLARRTKSFEDRAKLYQDFQEEIAIDPPGVCAYVMNNVEAWRKEVKGLYAHPMRILDLRSVDIVK